MAEMNPGVPDGLIPHSDIEVLPFPRRHFPVGIRKKKHSRRLEGQRTGILRDGFQIEGIRRKSMLVEGKFIDEYYMAKIL